MTTATRPLADHGTVSRHKHYGCKCEPCRQAYRDYQNARHRAQGYGTWQPLIDAEPVRRHIDALREQGVSLARIASAAGLYLSTINGFVYDLGPSHPRKRRVRPNIAEKILAVTAEAAGTGLVDATGTRRRLQALAAIGWPLRSLAPHTGLNSRNLPVLITQTRVYATTARTIADCYRKLANACPEDHGITKSAAARVRNRARREGWPDPTWWEDWGGIDDPNAPETEQTRRLKRDELAALRREEIQHLASFGIGYEEIARRLGMARGHVRDIIRELREAA